MFSRIRKHARILMHRRNAAAYVDGRYLHVDAKLSVKSKRDREIARDLAGTIYNEVGANESAFSLIEQAVKEDQHHAEVGQPDEPAGLRSVD